MMNRKIARPLTYLALVGLFLTGCSESKKHRDYKSISEKDVSVPIHVYTPSEVGKEFSRTIESYIFDVDNDGTADAIGGDGFTWFVASGYEDNPNIVLSKGYIVMNHETREAVTEVMNASRRASVLLNQQMVKQWNNQE